jgi:GT2 family glycosyltransferase
MATSKADNQSGSLPELTVVTVNWNGGDTLRECLETLRESAQTYPCKVLVMDNDSKDGSRQMAEKNFPEFETINTGANLGFGKANNLARNRITTPYVLILNPDTRVRPDSLKGMVEFLKGHSEVGLLGCMMRHPDGTIQPLGLQWFPTPVTIFVELVCLFSGSDSRLKRLFPYGDATKSGYVSKIYGGCFMARKDVIDKVGWFDDRYFMYVEDVDLCRTVLRHGWKVYYLADVDIVHEGGAISAKARSSFPILMFCESMGKYMAKYYGITGHLAFRLAVLSGSSLRMLVLSLLFLIKAIVPKSSSSRASGSAYKQYLMILWSLGLRRAFVPQLQRQAE